MKITRLLGAFLAVGLALTLSGGCWEGAQIRLDPASLGSGTEGEGEVEEPIDVGGGDGTFEMLEASICRGEIVLPEAKDSYFRLDLSQVMNLDTFYLSGLIDSQIMDEEFNLPIYDNYRYEDEESNVYAMYNQIVNERFDEVFGIALSEMCVSGSIHSRFKDFCADEKSPCFNTFGDVVRNLGEIPFFGQFLVMAMNILPPNVLGMIQAIGLPMPDPAVMLMNEVVGGSEIQIVVDNFDPDALPKLKGFIEWFWPQFGDFMAALQNFMKPPRPPPPDFDTSVPPPDFSLMANAKAQVPIFAPIEGESYEGCYMFSFGEEADPDAFVTPGSSFKDLALYFCTRGNYLLIATENSIDELIARAELETEAGSMREDACYDQTYMSLWNSSMNVSQPAFMACLKGGKLNDTLVAKLNERDPMAMMMGGGNPIMMFTPFMKDDIEIYRLGVAALADKNGYGNMTLQLYEGGADPDMKFSFGLGSSSTFNDALDIDAYIGPDVMGFDIHQLMGFAFKLLDDMIVEFMNQQGQ